jgi:hypothetical protein
MAALLHVLSKALFRVKPHNLANSLDLSPWEAGWPIQLSQEVLRLFMECEVSLKCPQKPATIPYPEPHKLIPYHVTLSLKFL